MFLPRLKLGRAVSEDPVEDAISVFIQVKELFQHLLVIGKSGTGKSVFLLNWFLALCWFKAAKILIEPSGFLARDAYSACKGKAIYCSLKHPVSINPLLQNFDPNTVSAIVREAMNQVIAIVTREANRDMTVKMSVILDKAILSCLDRGRPSLAAVRDEIAGLRGDNETRDGISSRLNFLLGDPRMMEILCGDTTLDIANLIKSQGTFILDCSGMTQEQLVFVGNLVSQGVKNHLRFANHDDIQPLALILDEAHNFISPSWPTILKEGRKYGLSAMIASQDLAFFSEQMRRVLLNVGSIVSFRVGHHEAQYIAKELRVETEVLQFMEKYHHAYLTPSSSGIARAPRPPIFNKLEIPTSDRSGSTTFNGRTVVEKPPQVASVTTDYTPMNIPKAKWFPRVPYSCSTTTDKEA